MFRFILPILLAFGFANAFAQTNWTPLAKVGSSVLEVDTNRFNYITVKSEPAELNVVGYYRIADSKEKSKTEDESVFWTNVKTCNEGRGKLVMILVEGSAPVARTWTKEGRMTYDVIGQSLCAFHAAVREQVIKERSRGGAARMI